MIEKGITNLRELKEYLMCEMNKYRGQQESIHARGCYSSYHEIYALVWELEQSRKERIKGLKRYRKQVRGEGEAENITDELIHENEEFIGRAK